MNPNNSNYLLAFIRISLTDQLILKHPAIWKQLARQWEPITFQRIASQDIKLYTELELATLQPSTMGISSEFLLASYNSRCVFQMLASYFKIHTEGEDRRSLHQYIYQALKVKPYVENNN